jgi:hypothetical protein
VLLGSTEKMGTGTNIQARMVALHHVDCPYRPSDLTQRDGRILRQGNKNDEVGIYIYVTEGSFDTYSWQTVQRKQGFISQLMTGKLNGRECEDVDEKTMSFAQVKAICSGDPRVLEQAEVEAEWSKLRRLRDTHEQSMWRLKSIRRIALANVEDYRNAACNIDRSIRLRRDITGDEFRGSYLSRQFTERKDFGEHVITQMLREIERSKDEGGATNRNPIIGNIGGFPLKVSVGGRIGKNRAELFIDSPYPVVVNTYNASEPIAPIGLVQSIAARLHSFEASKGHLELRILECSREAAEADRKMQDMAFPHEARFQEVSRRRQEIDDLLKASIADTVSQEVVAELPLEQPENAPEAPAADPPPRPDTTAASYHLVASGKAARLSDETRERVFREADEYAKANGVKIPPGAMAAGGGAAEVASHREP